MMQKQLLTCFLVSEVSLESRGRPKPLVPNAVFGMIIFIFTEVMFFSALISAYLIIRSGLDEWPPWGQPRLPVTGTALNTCVLLLSAGSLYMSRRTLLAGRLEKAVRLHAATVLLGLFFLVFQGYEWIQMLGFGLTMKSSVYGALFYLIISIHGLHVMGALLALTYSMKGLSNAQDVGLAAQGQVPCQILWYFVVGIWPVLYVLVYLI